MELHIYSVKAKSQAGIVAMISIWHFFFVGRK